MYTFISPIENLVEQFRRLPGVGYKSAVRMAFSVINMSEEEVDEFASALISAKKDTTFCKICHNISDKEICDICSDDERDRSVICVVEDTNDVIAVEKVREFKGLFHVLGGVISPSDGIGPEQLNIKELLHRIDADTKEVIIATNPSVEGEATSLYISKLLKPLGVKVSRLAYGIPAGAELEYTDDLTLLRALEGRQEI
ncbi:MAG: recombination protein RecR [Clostridia bacterium]|nr:recombination protein RecR [Clostridia bacterium]